MVALSILYYGFWVLNIVCVVRRKHNKIIIFLTWLLLFAIFASNRGVSGDAYKYKEDYELCAYGSNWSEFGYESLKTVCKFLGMQSYNQFLVVLFLLSSILLYSGIKKIKGNAHTLYALSLSFIFPAFAEAIRFFLAFAIFIFCLHYLYEGKKIKYFLGILVAFSFHYSSIFFLSYIFCYSAKNLRVRKNVFPLIICGVSFLTAIYTLITRRLPFVFLLSSFITRFLPNISIKVSSYFYSSTNYGFLILFFVYFSNYVLCKIMLLEAKKSKHAPISKYTQKRYNFLLCSYSVNMISAILLPLAVLNLVFYRLYFAQTFVNCFAYSCFNDAKKKKQKIDIKLLSFWVVFVAWLCPAFFKVNSIYISEMLSNSFFVFLGFRF